MSLPSEFSKRLTQLQHVWMGRPEQAIYFGAGIGDDLLCTAVARELKKRGTGRIVMFSKFPALFGHNPDIGGVYDYGYATIGRLRHWGYGSAVPHYSVATPDPDRDIFYQEHILTTMSRLAGLKGAIDLRPYLTLLPQEKETGQLLTNQIAIQSGGLGRMKNKDWMPDRYQAVVDQLAGTFDFVHLGMAGDPALQNVKDLRGKTSLRESAAILASSRVFVGQVGFLMHLGRAVDCRSVIVYGGREIPLVSGYSANENLMGQTACSPCWQRNRCDFNHECMHMIEPEAVIAAVHRQIGREGTPLPVDQVIVTDVPAESSVPPVPAKETQRSSSE